jgi:hypothetical protein
MAETHLSDEFLRQLTGNPGFASGGIVQPAQDGDDGDSVPAILSSGCVFFGRTGEDPQPGQDHG